MRDFLIQKSVRLGATAFRQVAIKLRKRVEKRRSEKRAPKRKRLLICTHTESFLLSYGVRWGQEMGAEQHLQSKAFLDYEFLGASPFDSF